MTTTFESTSDQSTQELPTIPTVEEMEAWGRKKVLRWIQQRNYKFLEHHDDLNNFNNAHIGGVAFVRSSYKFFKIDCGLSPGASLGLSSLVDEVKKGKFIPRT
jgi:hypothetical protein